MKQIQGIYSAPPRHWVGDGFPVRSMFSYQTLAAQLSPFLLLDYAGPHHFASASTPRGVGEHPHRGFETVTIVYHGEVAHQDSTGTGGVIGPGDVQWMTAGSGILHQEFHSPGFTEKGGLLEMVQLWVNLPASDKMTAPGYQAINRQEIPRVSLPGNAGSLRIIAGEYQGQTGPAHTFSPLNVWDMAMYQGKSAQLTQPEGWSTALVLLEGELTINGVAQARDAQLVVMSQEGRDITLETSSDTRFLLLSGQPLDEPIVGHGPFVMNSRQQVIEAINDFNAGRFGQTS